MAAIQDLVLTFCPKMCFKETETLDARIALFSIIITCLPIDFILTHLFFFPFSSNPNSSLTSVTICLDNLSTYTPSSLCSRTEKQNKTNKQKCSQTESYPPKMGGVNPESYCIKVFLTSFTEITVISMGRTPAIKNVGHLIVLMAI